VVRSPTAWLGDRRAPLRGNGVQGGLAARGGPERKRWTLPRHGGDDGQRLCLNEIESAKPPGKRAAAIGPAGTGFLRRSRGFTMAAS